MGEVRAASRLPQPPLPPAGLQPLSGLDGLETRLALDDVEAFTLSSFRELLNIRLGRGLPATVAEVSSADAGHRVYSRHYDGAAWCRYVKISKAGRCDAEVEDPVSRQRVTWVKVFFWSPRDERFYPLYDQYYTPPGSLGHLVARAILGTIEAEPTPAAWAHFGWVMGGVLGLSLTGPPISTPPLALADDLLELAAGTGPQALAGRCLSAWRPPVALDRAAIRAAAAGDRPMLARLVAHGAAAQEIDPAVEDSHHEARRGGSWAREGGCFGALRHAVAGILPGLEHPHAASRGPAVVEIHSREPRGAAQVTRQAVR